MKSKTPHKKTKRRVGRGPGSMRGKTAGRGHKGQKARTGSKSRRFSEGGQNTVIRRLPKRGFNHPKKNVLNIVNLMSILEFEKNEIKLEDWVQLGYMKNGSAGIKVLASGELNKALTIHAHAFSGSAKEKIEKAGGKAILIAAVN